MVVERTWKKLKITEKNIKNDVTLAVSEVIELLTFL